MSIKGYVPVDIPTKKYLKAYIQLTLGEKPVISQSSHIGSKLVDLMQSKRNHRMSRYQPQHYPETIRVYLNKYAFKNKGCNINHTNIIAWNCYLESYVKEHIRFLLDTYLELTMSLEASIEIMRDKTGLDENVLTYDQVKKDYYRYRKGKDDLLPRGGYKKLVSTNVHCIL